MPIEFQCHDCDASYRVEERLAGKQARCRHCGATMNIPRVSGKRRDAESGGDIDLQFRDDDEQGVGDPNKPTKPGSTIIASPVLNDDAPSASEKMPVVAWNPNPNPPPFFPRTRSASAEPPRPTPLPPQTTFAPTAQIIAGPEGPMLAAARPSFAVQPAYDAPSPPLRSRRYRPNNAVGLDGLTPLMLLLYIAAVIGGHIYQYVNAPAPPAGAPPLITPGLVATQIILRLVLFFAVSGPCMLLAVFITSRLMRFELPGGAYARACAVAATPGVLGTLLFVMPRNIVLMIVFFAAIIPITVYVLRHLFQMTSLESFVAWLICVPLFIASAVLTLLVVGAATLVGIFNGVGASNSQASAPSASPPSISSVLTGAPPGANVGFSSSPRISPPAPVDPNQEKFDLLRRETAELMNGGYVGSSREAAQARLGSLRDSARSIQSSKGAAPEYAELIQRLDDLDRRAAALPSERPDPSLAQPPDARDQWDLADASQQTGLSADELAVAAGIAMRLPANALLDLKSSASDAAGLLWRIKPGFTRMTIATRPRSDPTQQRPWIVPRSIATRSADASKLLVIESDQPQITTGTIAGTPFTRVADAPSNVRADRRVTYAALIDKDKWLHIQLLSTDGDATAIAAFDASVRSIRRLRPGELIADPFAPAQLVKRLADDPDHAIPLLKQAGPAAEDALIDVLKTDNRRAKAGAIEVLRATGTDKCLPAIREIAAGPDTYLADAAREVLRRLSPSEADAIALAVLDLKSHADAVRRRKALETLATAVPDETRRTDVSQAIQDVVFAEELSVRDEAAHALATWATPEVVPRLLPWLDEHENMWHRQTAMTVLAATRDRRAVFPIVRWIIKEPENVVKALSAMGPVAEDEVIKLLKERDPAVRRNAARILEQIGGQKSLIPLQRASTDPRDASAADSARRALEVVRDRTKSDRTPVPAATRP